MRPIICFILGSIQMFVAIRYNSAGVHDLSPVFDPFLDIWFGFLAPWFFGPWLVALGIRGIVVDAIKQVK